MFAKSTRNALLGVAVISAASLVAYAQDQPEAPLSLSGTYYVTHVRPDTNTVAMDFTATITNNGADDVTGDIVLRHPNVIQKVWYRFGSQSISSGGNVKVNGAFSMPRDQYDDWANGGPALFMNRQNDRGDIKVFRIPLSKVPPPVAKK